MLQLETPPASESLKSKLPGVADLSLVNGAINRNQVITAWYEGVDRFMTNYLGEPDVPTWARFAKHASYNAGIQLKRMEKVTDLLERLNSVLKEMVSFEGSVKNTKATWKKLSNLVKEISETAKESEFTKEGVAILLKNSGFKQGDVDTLLDIPKKSSAREKFGIIFNSRQNIVPLLRTIPKVKEMMTALYDATANANQRIYEFMAPRFALFANTELGVAPTKPLPDPSAKFLDAALSMYKEVQRMSWESQLADEIGTSSESLLNSRRELAAKANVIATFGEQLYRVQPQFEKVRKIVSALSGQMKIVDPTGERRILSHYPEGDWSNLYTRMGIDPAFAPQNPFDITPDNFPRLLPSQDRRFQGTLGQILTEGTIDVVKSEKLKLAPTRK